MAGGAGAGSGMSTRGRGEIESGRNASRQSDWSLSDCHHRQASSWNGSRFCPTVSSWYTIASLSRADADASKRKKAERTGAMPLHPRAKRRVALGIDSFVMKADSKKGAV